MATQRGLETVPIKGDEDIRTAIRNLAVCGQHVRFVTEKDIFAGSLTDGDISKFPGFVEKRKQNYNRLYEGLTEGVDYRIAGSLDVTDTIMNATLWIGLYPGMGEAKFDYMIDAVRNSCLY